MKPRKNKHKWGKSFRRDFVELVGTKRQREKREKDKGKGDK